MQVVLEGAVRSVVSSWRCRVWGLAVDMAEVAAAPHAPGANLLLVIVPGFRCKGVLPFAAFSLILDLAGLECFGRGFWVFGFTSCASASPSSMVRLAPARLHVFSTPPARSPAPHSPPEDPRARSDQETQPYYRH